MLALVQRQAAMEEGSKSTVDPQDLESTYVSVVIVNYCCMYIVLCVRIGAKIDTVTGASGCGIWCC